MRKLTTALLTGTALLLFTACGGGGGGGDTPTVEQQSAAGFWKGTVTSNNGSVYDSYAIITESGEVRLGVLEDNFQTGVSQSVGKISVNGNQASGTLDTYYTVPGTITAAKDPASPTLALSATVSTENTLSGEYTSNYDSGTFSMTFDNLYHEDSSLAKIEGDYYNPLGGFDGQVYADGTFDGHYSDTGCSVNGKISIVNPSVNVYDAVVTGTCPGYDTVTLDGLAVFSPNGGSHLALSVSNESASTTPQFLKK